MTTLQKSRVTFDAESHTYELDGMPLQGVTPIVAWMFPDTYADIPQSVLDRAAAHGKAVHEQCQLAGNLGLLPDNALDETREYLRLLRESGHDTLAGEYLVSDGKDIASSIDVVLDDLSLADIKTTSKIHRDNVALQLGIYAWLFELQNPGLKAGGLYVIWLPKPVYGRPAMIELPRLPSADCGEVVAAYLRGDSPDALRARLFPNHTAAATSAGETLPATLQDAEAAIADIDTRLKTLKERRDRLADGLLSLMEKAGVKKWEGERLSLTYVAPTVRRVLDGAALKAALPDVYAAYTKETETKASVRVTIKKEKSQQSNNTHNNGEHSNR